MENVSSFESFPSCSFDTTDISPEPSTSFISTSLLNLTADNVLKTEPVTSQTNSVERRLSIENERNDFDEEIGEFYFESDQLALKSNSDYKAMLRALAILEAQRAQAIHDLDRLKEIRKNALTDPIEFVKKLQNKEDLNFPRPQEVLVLPYIDWSKYALKSGAIPPFNQRVGPRNWTKGFGPQEDDNDSQESLPGKQNGKNLVRGRAMDNAKSATFNQLWTAEEQKRLEELLVVHPAEEIESRRWEKIANDLGNRTPVQVASRIQKFFIKLSKAGMPVPGRRPNLNARKMGIHPVRRGRPCRQMYQYTSSSFFRHNIPPVFMGEMDQFGDSGCYSPLASTGGLADEDDNSNEMNTKEEENDDSLDAEINDPEYQELLFLKRLKETKFGGQALAQHVGYKCDRCGCVPIIGTRWHCKECSAPNSIDFCNDCVDCQHESGSHKSNHSMEPIKQAETSKPFLDGDYVHHFTSRNSNYLDPNYMPAA